MAGNHHHFPTFHKILNVGSRVKGGGLAAWLLRTFLTERGLLRLALYVILLVALAHFGVTRYYFLTTGATYFSMTPFGTMNGFSIDGGVTGWIYHNTVILLGPTTAEQSLVMVVLCLIGLASSAKRPEVAVRVQPAPKPLADPIPVVVKPAPPGRHPLDPDPDDPPLPPKTWSRPAKS